MPPPVRFSPRSSLDSQIHSTIDVLLKENKLASRELRKKLTSFRLELELLDRLFYKNKNQHRSALFWRKVTEMRRFGHKLDRYKPGVLVEDTRRWFWGPLDPQSPKMLKGSWTHFPDDKSLANAIKRLQLFQALCDETSRRLMKAFEHFLLCLQSAAFAPLLVTFCAICARFNSQVQDMAACTLTCSKALTRFAQRPVPMPPPPELSLATLTVAPRILSLEIEPTIETAEFVADPPPSSAPIASVTLPIPPPTEEKTPHVVKKPKKRARDEIDDIFGF